MIAMNLKKLCPSIFVFAVSMSAISWGDEENRSIEARGKLIEQSARQMTEPGGDGAGRAMSFQSLQKLGPEAKSAVPALTKALDHEDSYVRIQAAYTLWKVDRQAKAIPLLSKALADTGIKPKERALAASLLGGIGPPAKGALPTLKEATKAQEAAIRVNAARSLWTVDELAELAKPVLIDALKNDDLNVFSTAAHALGDIGFDEAALIAPGEAFRKDGQGGSKAYAANRALSGLANALKSKDARIRREAVSVMSHPPQSIIPEERDEITKALGNGLPPLPTDPKVRIQIKDNGTQAVVLLLNGPESVSGLNMKLSKGKWWIVK